MRPLTLVALCALSSGCFALDLDGFALPPCTSNAQCEVLNTSQGIAATACQRYQCAPQERTCALLPRDDDGDRDPSPLCGGQDCDEHNAARVGDRLNPRATERCDGVDNNCDGVIDEGAWRRSEPQRALSGFATPSTLTTARRGDGAMAVLTANGMSRASFGAYDARTLSPSPLAYAAELVVNGTPVTRADACPVAVGSSADFGGCAFADLVAAPLSAGAWFALSVNPSGCTAGQVRAGWFSESTGQVLLSGVRSALATGVDLTPTGCTGASRMPARTGASRVSIASIPDETAAHALGAWIAREPSATGCGTAAPVEALGLSFVTEFLAGGRRVQDVRGTNANLPRTLGATLGDGRPAVVSVPSAAVYAVAYGADGGGVRVHVIPAFAGADPSLDTSREAYVVRQGASNASTVVASVGAVSATGFELGLAWREGCDATGALWFSRVRVDAATPSTSTASAPVRVAEGARMPTIAYVAHGVFSVGAMRGGVAITESNDGGWLIGYVDGARAVGRRASALDGALIDEAPVVLGDARGDTRGVRFELAPSTSAGQVLSLTHDADGTALFGAELACRPTP